MALADPLGSPRRSRRKDSKEATMWELRALHLGSVRFSGGSGYGWRLKSGANGAMSGSFLG